MGYPGLARVDQVVVMGGIAAECREGGPVALQGGWWRVVVLKNFQSQILGFRLPKGG